MIDPDRFEEMRARLKERVKSSRYQHSMGVSQTAEQLARIYGVDENDAAVAGLLHDWDKALSSKELRRKAKKHGLAPKAVRKQVPGVLHALTAPYSLRKEFPELSRDVLRAISLHTCAAKDMEDLDMVVFVADLIEPGRSFAGAQQLRDAVGEVSLDELFFMAYASTLVYLISEGLPVHPDSLDVWNACVAKRGEMRALDAAGKDAVKLNGSSLSRTSCNGEGRKGDGEGEMCAPDRVFECEPARPAPLADGLASELAARIVEGQGRSHASRTIVIE